MKTEKIYTPKTFIYKHSNKLSPSREEKINNNNNEQQISAFSSTDVKLQTCRTTKYQPKTLPFQLIWSTNTLIFHLFKSH